MREARFAVGAAAAAADVARRRAERLRRTIAPTHTVGSLALTRTRTAEIPSGSSGTHKSDRAPPRSGQRWPPGGSMPGRGSLGVQAERCPIGPWLGSRVRAISVAPALWRSALRGGQLGHNGLPTTRRDLRYCRHGPPERAFLSPDGSQEHLRRGRGPGSRRGRQVGYGAGPRSARRRADHW